CVVSPFSTRRSNTFSNLLISSVCKTVYILDEPTTGLHTDDIKRLLNVLDRLVEKGDNVIVIKHNLDVIKTTDHIINDRPEGGDGGGQIVATGTPESIIKQKESFTGKYLKEIIDRDSKRMEALMQEKMSKA